jgi:hypothetical protein
VSSRAQVTRSLSVARHLISDGSVLLDLELLLPDLTVRVGLVDLAILSEVLRLVVPLVAVGVRLDDPA